MHKEDTEAAGAAKELFTASGGEVEGKSGEHDFPIVGIGASAGGLDAIGKMLKSDGTDPGMAFVVIQHLDPNHESALTAVLSRAVKLPIEQVQDGTRVERNHIYVIPPNTVMRIAGGVLRLTSRVEGPGYYLPIDAFLRSLADDVGNRAIAVILSGAASDGTKGVEAVKGAGGITFAQTPETAKYDSMPVSAIQSGCVDLVLPPAEIMETLAGLRRHPYLAEPPGDAQATHPKGRDHLMQQVFRLLRQSSKVDFTDYKPATIQRRIQRRMAINRIDQLEKYIEFLRTHKKEADALFQDMLINVTSFFREPEVFEHLKQNVYPALVAERDSGDPLRLWVPGCATGEEVYSHVISLMEFLVAKKLDIAIQVFGTDLNETAIRKARAGIYKENIQSDVSPERLRRFFKRTDGVYQISKWVRDNCVFALQNVFNDPPFSRMDLISCRNVLIYVGQALQKRVFPIFHHALNPDGFLVMGNTEGILGSGLDLFRSLDPRYKIYVKRAVPSPPIVTFSMNRLNPEAGEEPKQAAQSETDNPGQPPLDLQRESDRLLMGRYVPSSVVVNKEYEVLYTRGKVSRYLEFPPGRVSLSLLKMVREGMLYDLQNALAKARESGQAVRSRAFSFEAEKRVVTISVEVTPFRAPASQEQFFLIVFEEKADAARPARGKRAGKLTRAEAKAEEIGKEALLTNLRQELAATKEYLQSIIEEQEASNEELQSANEEVQSSNEELQSTNEELQTATEELESSNEELSTVNEELQHRNEQLALAYNDMNNIFSGVNIPMIMLGMDARVRRFTPQAEKVFRLTGDDVGRSIGHLKLRVEIPRLEELIDEMIAEVSPRQGEVRDREGCWYRYRIAPCRTNENKIDGTVLTLVDINDLKASNVDLGREQAKLNEVMRVIQAGLLLIEAPGGAVVLSNPRMEEILGSPLPPVGSVADYRQFRAVHSTGRMVEPHEWPMARSLAGEIVTDEEIEFIREDGSHVFLSVSSAPYCNAQGRVLGVVATVFDMTTRKSTDKVLRISEQLAATGRIAASLAHEVNNPLEALTNIVHLLKTDPSIEGESRRFVELMDGEMGRMSHITKNLLGLYREKPKTENFLVRDVADSALDLLAPRIQAKQITIEKQYMNDGLMHGLSGDIRQVVLNLLVNAIEATAAGGTVKLRIASAKNWEYGRLRGIRLIVADNGPGISTETRKKIFEPFFTTKGEKGTGLGLWVSQGLVRKYDGRLALTSSTDPKRHGTAFSVFLPSHLINRRKISGAE